MTIEANNSVGVHIRRGDFVGLGWDKGGDYYQRGMELLSSKLNDAHFYLVSDDIEWTKEQFAEKTM